MASTSPYVYTQAWCSDPDFVAARNRTIPPGGATFYGQALFHALIWRHKEIDDITDETPPIGKVPWDMTDFIYGQATWSTRHMPNILYRLKPDNDWVLFKTTGPPQQKVDAQGHPVYEQWPTDPAHPRPLLDFEVLPDRIGSQEHWWRFEAWRRLDPRIRWCDISMRMETPYRINDTLLRSRISRPKTLFCMLSWFQGPRGQAANDIILRGLTEAQIQANTTRGSTPGLIDPARGRAGGRIYLEYEGPGDDTESESSESGSDTESDAVRDFSGGSPVESSPLKAEPASDDAASNGYESQQQESDDEEEGGEDDEEERGEHDEEHDREDTIDLPPPKRRRTGHEDQKS